MQSSRRRRRERPTIPIRRLCSFLPLALGAGLAFACAPSPPASQPPDSTEPASQPNPRRNAYFGDLHVHTSYSLDAFLFGTRATPDDAYRFARGASLAHPAGYDIELEHGPLDFYAVTDHAGLLGHMRAMTDPGQKVYETELGSRTREARSSDERLRVMASLGLYLADEKWRQILDPELLRSAWQEIVAAAERHYEPGRFTTFIGYEYTSGPEGQNLHRNVIFRGSQVPSVPFSVLDSANPEDLWAWMEGLRGDGMRLLAIPHNSNESNGLMFRRATFTGDPLDASWAELRMRNEPIVEVTQVKGTSETHPTLSPTDEWADFEIYPYRANVSAGARPSDPPGSYVRDAYLSGLELEESGGFNPFRFGLIGSSDTHNAAASAAETSFVSKIGLIDATPQQRGSVPLDSASGGDTYADVRYGLWGASGLAGVWAEENTREAIFDALTRKETFATSGPRIRVRFFAGYELPDGLADAEALEKAYAGGVPMGGDLRRDGERVPRFLAHATRDPNAAPLQRLQIVKGWVEDGAGREQLFDVACSDDGTPDPATHRCPGNGATVDLSDCSFSVDKGDGELEAVWSDPGFEPAQRALYYVRVLENPTCRWSTWDAVRAGVEPNPDLPETLQERAWSSPIWYLP